jgi:Rhodopirellula transposase DDE domain
MADEVALAAKYAVMRKILNERQWRVYLGTEAVALGYGGIAAVARASGASEPTVAAGAEEAADEEGPGALPPGRSRRPGAGRPRAEDTQPGLKEALAQLLEEGKRGDPMSEITWSILSLRDIARQMARLGFAWGKDVIARLMREDGWSLQGMAKVLEGRQHPGRDRQFRHIAAMTGWYRRHGYPVISVDTKKKEMPGAYGRDGKSWRPGGDPVKVRDHDFAGRDTVTIAPYGVYDVTANRGFVSVGTSRDTAAFAVNAIRLWWREEGQFRYPGAPRLLVTCDAGGSNGHRCRLWKEELAALAEETGLKITVCHFPPGTSKWNKIEHALFCHITRTWSARPLMTIEDAVAGIAATITSQGLKCTAVRDERSYPGKVKVSDLRMRWLEEHVIVRHGPHRDWNYTILPAPRSAPEPEPEPDLAGRVPAAVLNHPALTGMTTADVNTLVKALEVPFGAHREQRNYTARARYRGSGDRVRAVSNGRGPGASAKLALAGYVLAARLRSHLNLPMEVIAVLLGADRTTIGHAITLTHRLIAGSRIPLPAAAPPPQTPLRTPAELLRYTAAAGITLTLPQNGQTMPERFRTRQPSGTPTRPKPKT